MARRSPPTSGGAVRRGAGAGRDPNPFRTLVDMQDALQSRTVFVLDGSSNSRAASSTTGNGDGTAAQDTPAAPGTGRASASAAAYTGDAEAANGGASVARTAGTSSSSSNSRPSSRDASTIGPIAAAAAMAGGRGYTAEAWEPARRNMLEEQHALAAKLRAVLEDAMERERERDANENGDGMVVEGSEPGQTILQRHAHTVLQLLGVTEAINGGYVLDDYAAPYLIRLAQRQHRRQMEQDDAVQVLRQHRSVLAQETTDAAEADNFAEPSELLEPAGHRSTAVPQRRNLDRMDSTAPSHGQRVTANEYAKVYLTGASRKKRGPYKKKKSKSGGSKRKSSKSKRRSENEAAKSFSHQLGQVQYQQCRPQQKKQKDVQEVFRYQAAEEAVAEANARKRQAAEEAQKPSAQAGGIIDLTSSKHPSGVKPSNHPSGEEPASLGHLQSTSFDEDDHLPIMHVHKKSKVAAVAKPTMKLPPAFEPPRATIKPRPALPAKMPPPPPRPLPPPPRTTTTKEVPPSVQPQAAKIEKPAGAISQEAAAASSSLPPAAAAPAASTATSSAFSVSLPPSNRVPSQPHGSTVVAQKPPAEPPATCTTVAEAEAATKAAAPATTTASKPLPKHNLFSPSRPQEDLNAQQAHMKQPAPRLAAEDAKPPAHSTSAPISVTLATKATGKTRQPRRKAMKCHHCRNNTDQYRRCSYWKINGTQCRFVYCQICLEGIYNHTAECGPWEQCTSDKEWHCPSCLNKCQCKPCVTRREKEEKRLIQIASSGHGERGRRNRRGGGTPSDFAHMF